MTVTNALTIAHLEAAPTPLFAPRSGRLRWDDEAWHEAEHARDPKRYALLALMPGVHPRHRSRILLRLLLASWAGLDAEGRATLSRVVRVLVLGLPATDVLTVLVALRHRRANHKHVTRATMWLIGEHPQIETLLASHRRVVVACLEHALGKATARGCAKALASGAAGARPIQRFATNPAVVAERVRALYAAAPVLAPAEPARSLVDLDLVGERPDTVTATNRGDVAATLVHVYRGGASAELEAAIERYVDSAAEVVARFPGTLAVVLDGSGSMRGYGEREWAVLSQTEALRRVLERRCDRLVVVPVGTDEAPQAGGTDLATGLLDALATRPDLVAIVSDGYENTYPGDLARVVTTLPRVGETTPIVFCHSTFGHSDDLSLRRPAPDLPERVVWHEADFGPLLLWLLAHTGTAAADEALRAGLRLRLAAIEALQRGDEPKVLEGSLR